MTSNRLVTSRPWRTSLHLVARLQQLGQRRLWWISAMRYPRTFLANILSLLVLFLIKPPQGSPQRPPALPPRIFGLSTQFYSIQGGVSSRSRHTFDAHPEISSKKACTTIIHHDWNALHKGTAWEGICSLLLYWMSSIRIAFFVIFKAICQWKICQILIYTRMLHVTAARRPLQFLYNLSQKIKWTDIEII